MKIKYKFTASHEIKKSPNGKYFATIGGTVALWDTSTGKKITSFGQIKNPSHINFSHSSKLLAVKNTSGKVALYDIKEIKHLKSYVPTKSEGCELFFTPDDRYIVSADWDGNIYTIEIESGKIKILRSDTDVYKTEKFLLFERKVLQKERMMYRILHFDGVSNEFTFYTRYKRLVWKYPFSENEPFLPDGKYVYEDIAFSRANKCYAITRYNKENKMFIVDEYLNQTLKEITVKNNNGWNASIEKVAFSPDGKLLALLADNDECVKNNSIYIVYLMEYPSLNILDEYKIPFGCFVEFTQDGTQLLVGSWSKGYCIDLTAEEKVQNKNESQIEDLEKYIEENGLSAELISQVDENELIEALFFVSERIGADTKYKSEAEWIEKLPHIYRLAHLIYWFDNETSEGGLSQYIFNSQCELCGQLKEAFKKLNLPEHIKIINKAVKLYSSEELDMYDAKWEKLNEQCEELDENPADALYRYIVESIEKQ